MSLTFPSDHSATLKLHWKYGGPCFIWGVSVMQREQEGQRLKVEAGR